MPDGLNIKVNGKMWPVAAAPDTPLLYVLSNELRLQGPRFGCGLAQCGSCSVLADGVEIRSCITPVASIAGKSITTLEGLPALYAEQKGLPQAPALHPLQQAFVDVQAIQCGYCYNGMTIKGSELLAKNPKPVRRGNSRAYEWPSLPLRNLSAGDEGNFARRRGHGGRPAMTLHAELALSRRNLLRAGGVLIVGFSMGGTASPAAAARGDAAGPPDPSTVDSWIVVHSDNTATIYFGKGEFGQGNTTGLLQIAGEELDLDMSQLKWVRLDTNVSRPGVRPLSFLDPHRGDFRSCAPLLRRRAALFALASARLGVQRKASPSPKAWFPSTATPSRSISLWQLLEQTSST